MYRSTTHLPRHLALAYGLPRQLTLDVDRGLLDIGTINPFTVAPNDGSGEPS